MFIDPADTDHSWQAMHRLYLSFVQPRPIALVSTMDEQGRANLAPFSFYNMVSANPPVVAFSPALNRMARPKDTLRNIWSAKEFVIATVTELIAEKMNICSTEFAQGINEFEKSGLTPSPAKKVRANLVVESPVNIECRMRQVAVLGDQPGAGQLVFGDVIAVHVDDAVLTAGDLTCDPAKLQAIGRMGGDLYARTTHRFSLTSLRNPDDLAKRGPATIKED